MFYRNKWTKRRKVVLFLPDSYILDVLHKLQTYPFCMSPSFFRYASFIHMVMLLQVDVIVNSTNTNLDLKVGTLSRSLLKVGGETILQELQRKYSDGIKLGEIAVSTGGNLLCNEIFHGVLVKWDKGQGTAEKVINHIQCFSRIFGMLLTSRFKLHSTA